jgi:hypothetical protein
MLLETLCNLDISLENLQVYLMLKTVGDCINY